MKYASQKQLVTVHGYRFTVEKDKKAEENYGIAF